VIPKHSLQLTYDVDADNITLLQHEQSPLLVIVKQSLMLVPEFTIDKKLLFEQLLYSEKSPPTTNSESSSLSDILKTSPLNPVPVEKPETIPPVEFTLTIPFTVWF